MALQPPRLPGHSAFERSLLLDDDGAFHVFLIVEDASVYFAPGGKTPELTKLLPSNVDPPSGAVGSPGGFA